ncbi:MAG: trigger factor [Treponemataceae bacterium]|nr:MAG: trigger factor [Treponemataceae bacterium]
MCRRLYSSVNSALISKMRRLQSIESALKDIFERIEEKPYAYSQPQLDKMPDADFSKDVEFEVTYDVFPQVKITDFAGLTVKEPSVEITDDDTQKELARIQERNAIIRDKKEGEPACQGNLVTCSWHELDDAGNLIAGSERADQVLMAGESEGHYGLGADVIGMTAGETRDIVKSGAADREGKGTSGPSRKFRLFVSAVKVKDLPEIDDELAQDVDEKFKTLADLKADIVRQLETAKNRKIEALKIRALLDELIARNPFDIPDSMARAEFAMRMNSMAMRLGLNRADTEKFARQQDDESFEEFRPIAEKSLKSNIITASIIKDRNIAVTDEDIEEEYKRIAEETGSELDDVKQHYNDEDSKVYFSDTVRERKLYKELFSLASVQKGDIMSFEELMKHE